MKLDNLHFSFMEIDGYQKAFNFVISEREAGKTTAIWIKTINKWKKDGKPVLIMRRLINDITETYINDIAEVINKFNEDNPIEFKFRKGALKEGVVDIFIENKLFGRLIALSNPMARIKSLILKNISHLVFDEFICNTRMGEKYLEDEAFKFKEVYNTFQRETENLKCYFLGNPYSLYNPYFIWIGAKVEKLQRGMIQSGPNWVIQCYQIKPELKELILKKNPLYQFDDSYTKYAFDGMNVNDQNIRVRYDKPDHYSLLYGFHIDNKYIAIWRNNNYLDDDNRYYVERCDEIGKRRKVFAFEFSSLVNHACLMGKDEMFMFRRLKEAIRFRAVEFDSYESYYLMEEIYKHI